MHLGTERILTIPILGKIKKLFKLDNAYYCLPESLLLWNELIDKIFLSVLSSIEKISEYAKSVYPDIKLPLAFYDKKNFAKIINEA